MAEYVDKIALRQVLYDEDAITMKGLRLLNQFPVADVKPVVRGRWVHLKSANTDQRICTACQHTQPITGLMNYCPVCGATMDAFPDA